MPADDRREVLWSEPKAVGEILTPKQRDTVRNDVQSHGVIDIQVRPTRRTRAGRAGRSAGESQTRLGRLKPRRTQASDPSYPV
jgi:hypothetical protein